MSLRCWVRSADVRPGWGAVQEARLLAPRGPGQARLVG